MLRCDNKFYLTVICWWDNVGTGIKPPTGWEIDEVYLDENEKEINKEIDKWKQHWPTYVSQLCVIYGLGQHA
jgi:hypothetical protein